MDQRDTKNKNNLPVSNSNEDIETYATKKEIKCLRYQGDDTTRVLTKTIALVVSLIGIGSEGGLRINDPHRYGQMITVAEGRSSVAEVKRVEKRNL